MVAEMTDDVAGPPEPYGYGPRPSAQGGGAPGSAMPHVPDGYFRPTSVPSAPGGSAATDPARWAAGRILDAMAHGELEEAARWAVEGVTADPACVDVYRALEQLGAVAGRGGLHLFSFDADSAAGVGAARAGLLAWLGQFGEAVEVLARTITVDPTHPWASAPWVVSPVVPERVQPDIFTLACSQVSLAVGSPVSEAGRVALAPFMDLVRAVVSRHRTDARLLLVASGLARRVGAVNDALAWAEAADRQAPSFSTAVILGYAYQAAGRISEAEQAMYRALREKPDSVAICVDLGEMFAADGRPDEGLAWLDRALSIDPGHRRARASVLRVRNGCDGRIDHLVELAAMVAEPGADPDDPAEAILADACAGRVWLASVPPGSGMVMRLLRELTDQRRPRRLDNTRLTLPSPDPPSALLALSWACPGVVVDVADVASPDPRGPLHPVHHWVWRYSALQARPTVPEPGEEAVARMVAAAERTWRHPLDAFHTAAQLDGVALDDLLGLLVHPPVPGSPGVPDWAVADPALWIRTVQYWGCLAITRSGDEPWAASERRAALSDLAFGPEDWVCEAALAAMATLAWADPGVRDDVAPLVMDRLIASADAARQRGVPILTSVAAIAMITPALAEEGRTLARTILSRRAARRRG